eukprot:evm.model.scf_589.7 EVM.evm.TU.scf_589.7   scf_589:43008-52170(-)
MVSTDTNAGMADVNIANRVATRMEQRLQSGSRIARPGGQSSFGYSGGGGSQQQSTGERKTLSFQVRNRLPTTPRTEAQRSNTPEPRQSPRQRVVSSPPVRNHSMAAGRIVDPLPTMLGRRPALAKQPSASGLRKGPTSGSEVRAGSELKPRQDAPAPKRTNSAKLLAPRKPSVFSRPVGGTSGQADAVAHQRGAEMAASVSRGQPDHEETKGSRSMNSARRASASPRQMASSRGEAETLPARSGLSVRRRSPSPTGQGRAVSSSGAEAAPVRSGIARKPTSLGQVPVARGEANAPPPQARFTPRLSPVPMALAARPEGESEASTTARGSLGRRRSPSPSNQGSISREKSTSDGPAVRRGLAIRRRSPSPTGQAPLSREETSTRSSQPAGSFRRRSPSPLGQTTSLKEGAVVDGKAPASRIGSGHMRTGSGRKLPSPRAAGPVMATRGGASAKVSASPRKQAEGQASKAARSIAPPGSGMDPSPDRTSFMPRAAPESQLGRVPGSGLQSRSLLSAHAPARNPLLGTDAHVGKESSLSAVPNSRMEQRADRRLSLLRDSDSHLAKPAGPASVSGGREPASAVSTGVVSSRRAATTPRKQAAPKEAARGQASAKSRLSAPREVVESASSRETHSLASSKLGRPNSSRQLGLAEDSTPSTGASTTDALLQRRAAPGIFAPSPPSSQDKEVSPSATRQTMAAPRTEEVSTVQKRLIGSQAATLRRSSSPTPRRQSRSPTPRKQSLSTAPKTQTQVQDANEQASSLQRKPARMLLRKDQGSSLAVPPGSRIQRDSGVKRQPSGTGDLACGHEVPEMNREQAGQGHRAQLKGQLRRERAGLPEDGATREESTTPSRAAVGISQLQKGGPLRKEGSKENPTRTLPRHALPAPAVPAELRGPTPKKAPATGSSALRAPASRSGRELTPKRRAASPVLRETMAAASRKPATSLSAPRNASATQIETAVVPEKEASRAIPRSKTRLVGKGGSDPLREASRTKPLARKTTLGIMPRETTEPPELAKHSKGGSGLRMTGLCFSPRKSTDSASTKEPLSASALQRGSLILREKVSNLLKEMGSSLPGRRTMSAPAPLEENEGGEKKVARGKVGLTFRKRGSSDGGPVAARTPSTPGMHGHKEGEALTSVSTRPSPLVTRSDPGASGKQAGGALTPRGGRRLWQHATSLLKKAGPTGRHRTRESAPAELASPRIPALGTISAPVHGGSHRQQPDPATSAQQAEEQRTPLADRQMADDNEQRPLSTSVHGGLAGSSPGISKEATSPRVRPSMLSALQTKGQLKLAAGEQQEHIRHQAMSPSGTFGPLVSPKAVYQQRLPTPGGQVTPLSNGPQSSLLAGPQKTSQLGKLVDFKGRSHVAASAPGVSGGQSLENSKFGFNVDRKAPQIDKASAPDRQQVSSESERMASSADSAESQPSLLTGTKTRSAAPASNLAAGDTTTGHQSWQSSPRTVLEPASPSSSSTGKPVPPPDGPQLKPKSSCTVAQPGSSSPHMKGQPASLSGRSAGQASGSSYLAEQPVSPSARFGRHLGSLAVTKAEEPVSPSYHIGVQLVTPLVGSGRQPPLLSSPVGGHSQLPSASVRDLPTPDLWPAADNGQQPVSPPGHKAGQPASPSIGLERQPGPLPASSIGHQPTSHPAPTGEHLVSLPSAMVEPLGEQPGSLLSAVIGQPDLSNTNAVPQGQQQGVAGDTGSSSVTAVGVGAGHISEGQVHAGEKVMCLGRGGSSLVPEGLTPDQDSGIDGPELAAAVAVHSAKEPDVRADENAGTQSLSDSTESVFSFAPSNDGLQQVTASTAAMESGVGLCNECPPLMDPKSVRESQGLQSIDTINEGGGTASTPSTKEVAQLQHAPFDALVGSVESWRHCQELTAQDSAESPGSASGHSSLESPFKEETTEAKPDSLEGNGPTSSSQTLTKASEAVALEEVPLGEDSLDASSGPSVLCAEDNTPDVKHVQTVAKENTKQPTETQETFSDEDALSSLSLSSLVKDECTYNPRGGDSDFEAGNPFYGVTDLSSDDDIVMVSTVQGRSVVPVPPEAWREDLFSPRKNPLFEQWAMMNAKAGEEHHDAGLPVRVNPETLQPGRGPVVDKADKTGKADKENDGQGVVGLPAGGTKTSESPPQQSGGGDCGVREHVQDGAKSLSLVTGSEQRDSGSDPCPGSALHKNGRHAADDLEHCFVGAQDRGSEADVQPADAPSMQTDSMWAQRLQPREALDSEVVEMSISDVPRAASSCSQSRVSEASETCSVESSSTFVFKPPVVDPKLESDFPTWQYNTAGTDWSCTSGELVESSDTDLWSRPPRCPGASETSISTKELLAECEFDDTFCGPADPAAMANADTANFSVDSSDIHSSVFEYTFDSTEDGAAPPNAKAPHTQMQNLFYAVSVEGPPAVPKPDATPPPSLPCGSEEAKWKEARAETDGVVEGVAGIGLAADEASPVVPFPLDVSSGSITEADEDEDSMLPPTPDAQSNEKRVFGKSESDSCESRAALGIAGLPSPRLNIAAIDEEKKANSALDEFAPWDSARTVGSRQESGERAEEAGSPGDAPAARCADGRESRKRLLDLQLPGAEKRGDVCDESRNGGLGAEEDDDLEDVLLTESPTATDAGTPKYDLLSLDKSSLPGHQPSPFAAAVARGGPSSTNLSVQHWLSSSDPKSGESDDLLSSSGSCLSPGRTFVEHDPQSSDHCRNESFGSSTQVSGTESGLSLQLAPKDEPLDQAYAQEGPGSRFRTPRRESGSRERNSVRGASSSGSGMLSTLSGRLADVQEDSPFEETAAHASCPSLTDYRDEMGNRLNVRLHKTRGVSTEIEADDGPARGERRTGGRMQRSSSAEVVLTSTPKASSGRLVDRLRRKMSISHSRRGTSQGGTPRKDAQRRDHEGMRELGCFTFLSPRKRGSQS